MFTHIFVGSNDLEKSRHFYDSLFAVLGGKPGSLDPKGRLVYLHDGGRFLVGRPINGQPATPANGGTIGFAMQGPEQADAWHAAGQAAGGSTCEDPPGLRANGLYLAYLRDPDGNKLCGMYMKPRDVG